MKNTKSQFFSTKKETVKWLDKYNIENYIINDDLSVDVSGDVNISNANLKKIPVKFGKVTGNFYCYNNNLISLTGSPKSVDGDFWCQNNHLTSLVGSPESVGGNFICSDNELTDLIGATKFINGYFSCSNNKLKNLKGSPESVGWYFACKNNQLTSLAGAPKLVEGYFDCGGNQLISLLEICDCNFKQSIYFNIDEKNFKQKKLIPILKEYYNSKHKYYELQDGKFQSTIKPLIEKKFLLNKLNNAEIDTKTKNIFI